MNVLTWNKETLIRSYEVCDRIMADRAKSFYQAFSLLPADRFRGVTALYAYNRYVDDLVDNDVQNHDKKKIMQILNQLKRALAELYAQDGSHAGEALAHFQQLDWWPAFEETVATFTVPIEPLLNQINGQQMDMEDFQIETMDDLVLYSSHVAGSVGIMMLSLLVDEGADFENPELQEACLHLGIGMQLTNILRDIGEDYRERRRIYLPSDLMKEYGVTEEVIAELSTSTGNTAERIPQAFIDLWEKISADADAYYQSINHYIGYFHPKAQFPLMAAAYSYHGIAQAVRNADYNCLTMRNYTSKVDRVKLIAKAKKALKNSESK